MSDLIRRSEVINILYQVFENHSMATDKNDSLGGFGSEVFKRVREMPTAYDTDNIVAELQKIEEHCLEMNDWQGQSAVVEAIEIVKQGGVSDDVCEWRVVDRPNNLPIYNTSCGYKLEEYFDTNACYCKQCGKKIKAVK
ncbi:MAG: hypothetical protein ACI4DU_03450 [Lachnospiraceae bacterium]